MTGRARKAGRMARRVLAAVLPLLLLAGCGRGRPSAGISDDGRIRGMSDGDYVNVLVQLGFKSDAGDGFYEFYYETDGAVGHVYDMSASVSVKGQVANVSGEVWSDGTTSWSTSGRGWQETGIPMRMDVAALPGALGYDGTVTPKRDDDAGYYVFEWEADLSRIRDTGVLSLVGELEGIDLSGTAKAALRTSQEDGSFVSVRIEADTAAMCVLLNHSESGKALSVPEDVKAATAPASDPAVPDSTDPIPDATGGGEADGGTPQEVLDLMEAVRAADGSPNLLEASSDHGVDYIYYETNLVNAWYAWAEIGRPEDGDAEALFLEKKAAMETVLGEGAYEDRGDYLVHVQKSDPATEEGLGAAGDWYAYLLAYGDGFVLNLTIQDWTSGNVDGVLANATAVAGNAGVQWHT